MADILAHQGDTCLHPGKGGVSGREYLSVLTVGYHACGKSLGIPTYFQTGQLGSSKKVGRSLMSIEVLRRASNFRVLQLGLFTLDPRLGSLHWNPPRLSSSKIFKNLCKYKE
ncbi:Uncharacterized protein Fot_03661 [Forsythia ovata]|uniref:Uncharacterized protein n=1 Tax=Forsythia ovata TaxID=205694 RepID=A0ABD1XAE8_9LAMI